MKLHKLLVLISLCGALIGCRDELVHNLSENEASRIMASLHGQKIAAQKIKEATGKWSVTVESSRLIEAMQHLDSVRLLKTEVPPQQKSGILGAPEQLQFEYERNVSREVESTLLSLRGVFEARVHFNLPKRDPWSPHKEEGERGSGSVLLLVSDTFSVNAQEIARLVGSAVGIDANAVTVLVSVNKSNITAESSHPPLQNIAGERSMTSLYTAIGTVGAGLLAALIIKIQRERFRRPLYEAA